MADQTLLKSQKSSLFIAISNAGLNPADFELVDIRSEFIKGNVSILEYKDESFYFLFDKLSENNFRCSYSPAEGHRETNLETGDWQTVLASFKKWTEFLKREVESPDLWKLMAEQKDIAQFESNKDESNSIFLPDEKLKIAAGINELKEYIKASISLDQNRIEIIDAKLNYLLEASGRLGRKDWKNLSIGVLINIFIGQVLPPTMMSDVFSMFGNLFNWIVKGIQLLN